MDRLLQCAAHSMPLPSKGTAAVVMQTPESPDPCLGGHTETVQHHGGGAHPARFGEGAFDGYRELQAPDASFFASTDIVRHTEWLVSGPARIGAAGSPARSRRHS